MAGRRHLQGMPCHQENLVNSNSPSANNQVTHTRPSALEETGTRPGCQNDLGLGWLPSCRSPASTLDWVHLLVTPPDHRVNQTGLGSLWNPPLRLPPPRSTGPAHTRGAPERQGDPRPPYQAADRPVPIHAQEQDHPAPPRKPLGKPPRDSSCEAEVPSREGPASCQGTGPQDSHFPKHAPQRAGEKGGRAARLSCPRSEGYFNMFLLHDLGPDK